MNGVVISSDYSITDWKPNQFLETVHHLGYNPEKITVSYGKFDLDAQCPFKLDEEDVIGATTNIYTGEITVYPKGIPSGYERGILAHEIFHVAFYNVMWELKKQLFNPSSNLPSKFIYIVAKKDELINSLEQFSTYADSCKNEYLNGNISVDVLYTEVLSEMARVYEMTGNLPNTKLWKQFYKDIEQTAVEMGVIRR